MISATGMIADIISSLLLLIISILTSVALPATRSILLTEVTFLEVDLAVVLALHHLLVGTIPIILWCTMAPLILKEGEVPFQPII